MAMGIPWDEVVQHSAIGVAVIKASGGTLTAVNEAYARMHGSTPEEMEGQDFRAAYTPEFRPRLDDAMKRVQQEGRHRFEAEHMRKDGSRFPVRLDITDIRSPLRGGFRVCYCQDLSGELERSGRLEDLIRSSQEAIMSQDLDGRVQTWNPAAEALFGYSAEDAVGRSVFDLIIPEDRRMEMQDMLHDVRAGLKVDQRATERLRKDGGKVTVDVRVSPIHDGDGKVVGASISTHDVGETQATRRALQRSEALMREAQEIAHMGNWELDLETETLTWSDQIFKIFEMDPKEVVPSYDLFLEAIHPDDRDAVDEAYRRSMEEKREYSVEHRILTPDGRVKYVRGRGRTDHDHSGKPIRSVGTIQDLTDRIEAERVKEELDKKGEEVERLAEENRMRLEFLNAAAHDLNTPLTILRLQLETLRRNNSGGKAVELIGRATQRMDVLVQDLLDAARLQAGRLQLDQHPSSLRELLDETAVMFRDQAKDAEVGLELIPGPNQIVSMDPDKVTQVLYNLVSNAIKFTPGGGVVQISAHDEGDAVRVQVADTGIGFTPQQKAELFQPFSRPHESMPGVAKGTGLGLYISRGIIGQHGGKLDGESAGPDEGATFWFTLPLEAKK